MKKMWRNDSRIINVKRMHWKEKLAVCGDGYHLKIPPLIISENGIKKEDVYRVTTIQKGKRLVFYRKPGRCSTGLHLYIPKAIEPLYKKDEEVEVRIKKVE